MLDDADRALATAIGGALCAGGVRGGALDGAAGGDLDLAGAQSSAEAREILQLRRRLPAERLPLGSGEGACDMRLGQPERVLRSLTDQAQRPGLSLVRGGFGGAAQAQFADHQVGLLAERGASNARPMAQDQGRDHQAFGEKQPGEARARHDEGDPFGVGNQLVERLPPLPPKPPGAPSPAEPQHRAGVEHAKPPSGGQGRAIADGPLGEGPCVKRQGTDGGFGLCRHGEGACRVPHGGGTGHRKAAEDPDMGFGREGLGFGHRRHAWPFVVNIGLSEAPASSLLAGTSYVEEWRVLLFSCRGQHPSGLTHS